MGFLSFILFQTKIKGKGSNQIASREAQSNSLWWTPRPLSFFYLIFSRLRRRREDKERKRGREEPRFDIG